MSKKTEPENSKKLSLCAENDKDLSLLSSLENIATIPFHMPGHKRNADFEYLLGAEKIDVTEVDGTDNLHDAKGILKCAMEFAADVFGVKKTRFLVNGSTAGILAGMRTATKRGDKVVVARNCHKSVYNAIELLGLEPYYVLPNVLERFGFYGSIEAGDIARALDESGAKLVVITSPTYEGVLSDIKEIARVCHEMGAVLFVDEAHGAHLGFGNFAESARKLGADIVVNSLHKTLPSLTQTALIHICSDRVDEKRLDESLAMFETSSPSYVLMSSIDGAVREIKNRPEMFANWWEALENLRGDLSQFENIKPFDVNMLDSIDRKKVFAYDNSKIVFLLKGANFSGIKFAKKLREEYSVELEMGAINYAIAMTGAGDSRASFEVLAKAVKDIDEKTKARAAKLNELSMSGLAYLPKKAFNPCEIDGLSVEYANIDESLGRVAAENIWAYPPGSPIVCKGEVIDENVVEYLKILVNAGVNVSSSLKDFPKGVSVVKE